MASIIKTISIPNRYSDNLSEIEEKLMLQKKTFSGFVVDKIIEENKPTIAGELSLDTQFEELKKFAQEEEIEVLKQFSHKAHIISLVLQAYLKHESYEGNRKRNFKNPREASRYLEN